MLVACDSQGPGSPPLGHQTGKARTLPGTAFFRTPIEHVSAQRGIFATSASCDGGASRLPTIKEETAQGKRGSESDRTWEGI